MPSCRQDLHSQEKLLIAAFDQPHLADLIGLASEVCITWSTLGSIR